MHIEIDLEVAKMPEAVKQFIVGTIIPAVAGAAAAYLASKGVLNIFDISKATATTDIDELGVFVVVAGSGWLTSHHLLLGHYSPAAKRVSGFAPGAAPTGFIEVPAPGAPHKGGRLWTSGYVGIVRNKPYKTGRLPAVRPAALKDFTEYATAPLPAPPPEVKPPQASYPIDGNDRYGDCTLAGADHVARAWNAETGEHDHLPTEAQIVTEYLKLTGGEDTGLVEADVLKTWHGEGLHLFGGQIAGYAPIDIDVATVTRPGVGWPVAIKQAIAFYGGAYLGINVGQPQQEQFQRGEAWTWVEGQEEDGHCVVALGYSGGEFMCATWGGLAALTPGFLAKGLEEAWVILPHQMVEARGDSLGLDLAALQVDLARV